MQERGGSRLKEKGGGEMGKERVMGAERKGGTCYSDTRYSDNSVF